MLFLTDEFTFILIPGIHDAPHAHEPHAAEVPEAPVLSRPEVPHPASVVGLLVHQPVAVHHMAGHAAAGPVVAVHEGIAVLHHLVHLAHEVLLLVDPHPVGSSVLFEKRTHRVTFGVQTNLNPYLCSKLRRL